MPGLRRDEYNCWIAWTRRDKRKSGQTKSSYAVLKAHERGHEDLIMNRVNRNPYPPGHRHDGYNEGYYHADPMGDHMGLNK